MRLATLRPAAAAVLLAGSLGLASLAHAGMFDDEEARKAIVDLRNRVAAVDEGLKARTAEAATTNAQLLEQVGALRRSLLDLNNQLEAMRGEIAKLRGNDEQITRELADLQRKQKDIGQATDERLRKLEPVKVTLDGKEFVVEQDERKAYDEAIGVIRNGDFDKAVAMLAAFQRRYVGSNYTDSTRFWLGNALYGKRDYKEAINAFRAFVAGAAEHPRAPEALLALANSQAEMKDAKAARKTLEELVKAYPASEAAAAAKERMATLK
jgi:tol-pal system protein YbgF